MQQLAFDIKKQGGKRKNAGRKNRSGLRAHTKREAVKASYPMHITIKVRKGLSSLRSYKLEREFKRSVTKAKEKGLRVIEYAIESDHLHLFAEADNNAKLGTAMKSFTARYGKKVRKHSGGKGPVFKDRYHMRILKSPRETKNVLKYVLFNHSKHIGDHAHPDELSSSYSFNKWGELLGGNDTPAFEKRPDCLSDARSWLAREGWKLYE